MQGSMLKRMLASAAQRGSSPWTLVEGGERTRQLAGWLPGWPAKCLAGWLADYW